MSSSGEGIQAFGFIKGAWRTNLLMETFTFHPYVLPEQFATAWDLALEQVQQAKTVVQRLHSIAPDVKGRHLLAVNEWWQHIVAQHHQGVGFEGLHDEVGSPLHLGSHFWPLDERSKIVSWLLGHGEIR